MKTIVAAVVLAATAVTAQAYIPTDVLVARFIAQYDADKNGEISRGEYLARAEARFRQLDTDGDGRISAKEAGAVIGQKNGSAAW